MSKRAIKLDGEIPAARRQPKKEAPKKPLTEKELEKAWRVRRRAELKVAAVDQD
jgi:hypothetical protein